MNTGNILNEMASAQLPGLVFVFVDYSFRVNEVRKALKDIFENHPLGDAFGHY
jgi:hypothetical protein